MTLAQAAQPLTPESLAMWRGLGLRASLVCGRQQEAEFASYRLDSCRKQAAHDRANAVLWVQQRSTSSRQHCESNASGEFLAGPEMLPEEVPASSPEKSPADTRSSTDGEAGRSFESLPEPGQLPGLASLDGTPSVHGLLASSREFGLQDPLEAAMLDEANDDDNDDDDDDLANEEGTGEVDEATDGEPHARRPVSAERANRPSAPSSLLRSIGRGLAAASEQSARSTPSRNGPHRRSTAPSRPTRPDSEPHGAHLVADRFMIVDTPKSLSTMSKVRRLLEVRKAEFDAWPAAERRRLKTAFASGDVHGRAVLDVHGLRAAFGELGLVGHSKREKAVLHEVLLEVSVLGKVNFFDFAFQLVPQVNQRLQEARSPKLYADFAALDSLGVGRLHQQECLVALRRHYESLSPIDEVAAERFWRIFERDFYATFLMHARSAGQPEATVDFGGFQDIASQLVTQRNEFHSQSEHRTAQDAGLSPRDETVHFGELAFLWRTFCAQDTSESGLLGPHRTRDALIACGVLPVAGELFERTRALFAQFSEMHVFRFSDLLRFVRQSREDEATARKAKIQALLASPYWAYAPPVAVSDMPALITESGLCRDCCDYAEDLLSIVEDCSQETADGLSLGEAIAMAGRVVESARALTRRHEAVVARQLHLSPDQVAQLRASFAGLTRTGAIEAPAMQLLLKKINPTVEPSMAEVEGLMAELSPRLPMRRPSILQEEEPAAAPGADAGAAAAAAAALAAATAGTKAPLSGPEAFVTSSRRVLRFDGYLRLMGKLMEG